jgi:thymidylate synthase
MMHQRSADTFLGLPFNIASYSMLVIIMANMLGYKPGKLIMSLGNVHLYEQHVEAVRTQIVRDPRPFPTLLCARKFDDIEEIAFDDFALIGYEPYEKIEAPMIA